MSLVIKGYKIKGTDLQTVEDVLRELQTKVKNRVKNLYAKLLANEIELLFDDIALNVLQRPTEDSIYVMSQRELNKKISWATSKNTPTAYNLLAQVATFIYKSDTYIKLTIGNPYLIKGINSIPNSECFDLTDDETDEANKTKADVWQEIMSIYTNENQPFVKQISPLGPIEPEWGLVSKHFHKPDERADLRIRYTLTSELLNLIGMQQEIPNIRLLPYLDEAMSMLDLSNIKEEGNFRKARSITSFINITEELVKANPNDEAKKVFDENDT